MLWSVTSSLLVNVPQHVKVTSLSAGLFVFQVILKLPPFPDVAEETLEIARDPVSSGSVSSTTNEKST